MKIRIKHPIIYDGTVLQRGRVYDMAQYKVADKHVESWVQKRLAVKVGADTKADGPTENKADAPEETPEDNPQEDKQEEKEQAFTYEELEAKNVPELKDMAKERGIKGYSSMKQAELIKAIQGE